MNAPVLLDLTRRAAWPLPVATRLDVFERLPSHYLHPSRCAGPGAPGMPSALASFGTAGTAIWHRYRSRALRAAQPSLARALPAALPADLVRLMLLDPAALARLARAGGVVLLAPGIGATIARDAVALLRRALGESLYQFALHTAATHHPGMAVGREGGGEENATRLVARIDPLGWSLIDAALGTADPGVRARVALKRAFTGVDGQAPAADGHVLAADEHVPVAKERALAGDRHAPAATPLALPSLTAREALTLTDSLLSHFEPAWFSSFNAIR